MLGLYFSLKDFKAVPVGETDVLDVVPSWQI